MDFKQYKKKHKKKSRKRPIHKKNSKNLQYQKLNRSGNPFPQKSENSLFHKDKLQKFPLEDQIEDKESITGLILNMLNEMKRKPKRNLRKQ